MYMKSERKERKLVTSETFVAAMPYGSLTEPSITAAGC